MNYKKMTFRIDARFDSYVICRFSQFVVMMMKKYPVEEPKFQTTGLLFLYATEDELSYMRHMIGGHR